MDVKDFYDDYVGRQVAVGINQRHHAILAWLRRFGLRPEHRVLEVGCGVGTLTQLLAKSLGPQGSIVAMDLSPRSIEVAEERLARFENVTLMVGDVLEAEIVGAFDVVVLPDVIEHIPIEIHQAVFARVATWLAPGGFALLHYPNPHYLEWCREHTPDVLQVIDQPIHADVLLSNIYSHGLYLDYLQTYSIWIREGDYVVAVLRRTVEAGTFNALPERRPSIVSRVASRIRRSVG